MSRTRKPTQRLEPDEPPLAPASKRARKSDDQSARPAPGVVAVAVADTGEGAKGNRAAGGGKKRVRSDGGKKRPAAAAPGAPTAEEINAGTGPWRAVGQRIKVRRHYAEFERARF